MKKPVAVTSLVALVMVLAVAVPAMVSQGSPATPANGWFWGPPLTCAQVSSGQYDDSVVVVEGQVGAKVDPQEWNIYLFSDGTATIRVNFNDAVPDAAIPKGSTVRIIGEVDNAEVDVYGLQTLGTTSVEPSATAAQINAGNFDNQEVVVEGEIGDQDPSFPNWNYYNFSDGTGTLLVDLEDELSAGQIPQNRTLLIFGKAEEHSGEREIDAGLMLLASGEAPPPEPDVVIYLPLVAHNAGGGPPPDDWLWGPTTPVSQVLAGSKDDLIVVVEGKITELIDTYPPAYKNYWFTDGTGRIEADFEDYIPAAAIPLNTTVRIIGDVDENNGYRKIDVDGMQTLGTVPVGAGAMVAEILKGDYADGTEVSLKGTFGALVNDAWNVYEFTDTTGTIDADLENKLSDSQVPRARTLLLYGEAEQNFGGWKIDAGLMLVAAGYGN